MNGTWALVPLKNLDTAKTRLSSTLGVAQRRELALAMAQDVVLTLVRVAAIDRVVLVCDMPEVVRLIDVDGALWFDTTSATGLNEELSLAARLAMEGRATTVLIVHADLPLLTPEAVERFLLEGRHNAGIPRVRAACCKDGSGTNLLLAPLPLPIPLVFGKNSLAGFRRAARARGVAFQVLRDAALSLDLDDPEDMRILRSLYASGMIPSGATARFLARYPGEEHGTSAKTTT